MRFFISFAKSLYDLNWLRGETKNPGQAWSYFFLLIFLISGLSMISFYLKAPDIAKEAKDYVNQEIPDFTATVKEGGLSVTELTQPYVLESNDFVFVVDTVSTGTVSIKDYLKNESMSGMMISREGADMMEANNVQGKSLSWKDMPEGALNKSQVVGFVNKFLSPTYLYVFSFLFFLLLYVGSVISGLVIISLGALIINWIIIVKTKKGRFNSLFLTGLYAVTLPLIANLLLGKISLAPLNGLGLLLMVLWLGLIVFGSKKNVSS